MNLSISSFRNHPESKVVAWLLLGLLATELLLRWTETRLSKDALHILSAPQLADAIRRENPPHSILVMGNSQARAGLLADTLQAGIAERRLPATKFYFYYPDGGNISSWRWSWRKYFQDCRPAMVVLCGGRSHFRDTEMDPISAANYFVAGRDAWRFCTEQLTNTEDRLAFLCASVSKAYANRKRVQRRLTDLILPYNRQVLAEIVEAKGRTTPAISGGKPGQKHNSLAALLAELQRANIPTTVVAMPSYAEYEVSPEERGLIHAANARLLDLRNIPGISRSNYYDNAHLDFVGARLLSRQLGRDLPLGQTGSQ